MPIEFGKFKGRDLNDPEIPTKYLEWLYGSMVTTVEEIQAELARREQAEANDVSLAERMVSAGFHAMSKECANDEEALRELTGTRAALEEIVAQYLENQAKVEETRRMNATRDSRNARNRRDAEAILKDKHADADDVLWAKKILNGH